jgi:hypothetical protein
MKINIFEYIVMRKMIFSSENPQKINKIKQHNVPDLYRSLHRIRFHLEFCLQFRQHGDGTGITDIIGGPHDFLPPRSDRSDEFPKLILF